MLLYLLQDSEILGWYFLGFTLTPLAHTETLLTQGHPFLWTIITLEHERDLGLTRYWRIEHGKSGDLSFSPYNNLCVWAYVFMYAYVCACTRLPILTAE